MARKRYSDEDVLKLLHETKVPLASRSVRMQSLPSYLAFLPMPVFSAALKHWTGKTPRAKRCLPSVVGIASYV